MDHTHMKNKELIGDKTNAVHLMVFGEIIEPPYFHREGGTVRTMVRETHPT